MPLKVSTNMPTGTSAQSVPSTDSVSTEPWICPICETQNTTEVCLCCGERKCVNPPIEPDIPVKKWRVSNRQRIIAICAGGAFLIILLFVVLYFIPKGNYEKAEKLSALHDYTGAEQLYIKAGDYKDAKAKAEEMVRQQHETNAWEAFKKEDYETAAAEYVAAENKEMAATAYISAGYASVYSKKYDLAVEQFNSAEQIGYKGLSDLDSFIMYAKGMKSFDAGKYDEASKAFLESAYHVFDGGRNNCLKACTLYIYDCLCKEKFDDAEKMFSDYSLTYAMEKAESDSQQWVDAISLLKAECAYDQGMLNTAKDLFEVVPEDSVYEEIDRDKRLQTLSNCSNLLSACGEWSFPEGKFDYFEGTIYYWKDLSYDEEKLIVRFYIDDNGVITAKGSLDYQVIEYISTSYGDTSQGMTSEQTEDFSTVVVNSSYLTVGDLGISINVLSDGLKVTAKTGENRNISYTYSENHHVVM